MYCYVFLLVNIIFVVSKPLFISGRVMVKRNPSLSSSDEEEIMPESTPECSSCEEGDCLIILIYLALLIKFLDFKLFYLKRFPPLDFFGF